MGVCMTLRNGYRKQRFWLVFNIWHKHLKFPLVHTAYILTHTLTTYVLITYNTPYTVAAFAVIDIFHIKSGPSLTIVTTI